LNKDTKTDSRYYQSIEQAFKSIGYTSNLIAYDYSYSDIASSSPTLPKIDLGVFGQEPLNYRSACFGIHSLPEGISSQVLMKRLRAFGAAQFFVVVNGTSEWWINGVQEPRLKETVDTDKIPRIIKSNKHDWEPDAMIRLKSGFTKPTPKQLDFIDVGLLPALEHEASEKMDTLIKEVVNVIERHKRSGRSLDDKGVFNLTFRLLTAKLLKDCDVKTSTEIDFTNPQQTLKAVSGYYSNKFDEELGSHFQEILSDISNEIAASFSFRNLSVDTLAYVYENTLVTRESRKKLGIHSTPSYVADYVLAQMPIEDIPRTKWKAFDPMCGHGIFLTATMRRMRTLMPREWSGPKRHEFFTKALAGTEIDFFATEVARMCLTLADFPESNGWNIRQADIFNGRLLEKLASETTILVGNPPFEVDKVSGKEVPKPARLLSRALSKLRKHSMIGMVMPRAFLDSIDYRKERESLLKDFSMISITALPDRVFRYADSETVVVVAHKHGSLKGQVTKFREVKDQERDNFKFASKVTWEDVVPSSYFSEKMHGRLEVPMMREVWEDLGGLRKLSDWADIRIGVQYEPSLVADKMAIIVRDAPFEYSVPAIMNAEDGFRQFVATDTVFISNDSSLYRKRAKGAWNLPWAKSKVVVPASRKSRGPWRSAAAIDKRGRFASRDFYAIWPKSPQISVETIAAIINSPIAEAFIYAHSSQRGTPKRVYEQIPIPSDITAQDSIIKSLVTTYLDRQSGTPEELKNLLLQIDAEILKLYNLPPRLERRILDLFWGKQRPVPFQFDGYIPPEMESWIPLHVYISKKYRDATPPNIFKNLPTIDNLELLKYLESVGRED
jgi:hypothetical protein